MSDIHCPVIPVLDLMIGQVVWAKSGQRHLYSPVDSKLVQSSDPITVARAIFNQTGCRWLYLADIDCFAGANPNWSAYQTLIEAGFKLLIDADWMTEDRIKTVIETFAGSNDVKLIISTETLRSLEQFVVFKQLVNAGIDVCFSIDMQGDHVISKTPEIAALSPLELVKRAYEQGIRNLIILDLKSVGSGTGISSEDSNFDREAFISEIANELTDLRLISGGGVRNDEDCQAFLSAGCQHVLVASAIFDCRITPDEIALLEPFRNHSKTRAAIATKV